MRPKPVSPQVSGPDITTVVNALPADSTPSSQTPASTGLKTAQLLIQKMEHKYKNNPSRDERALLSMARTLVVQLGGTLPKRGY